MLTPTINEFVRWTIELLNPEIETVSLSFNSMKGAYFATTSLPFFHVNTAFSNVSNWVWILETPIPANDVTWPRRPVPPVLVSSKSV